MDAQVIQLTKQALWLVLVLSAGPILAATAAGLIVAVLQAVTQIQEQTVQFLMRFVAIILTLFLTASLLGGTLYNFAEKIFSDFSMFVR